MSVLIRLINVYSVDAVDFLYRILRDRLKDQRFNISHTKLPTKIEHVRFIRSKPYRAWYLIHAKNTIVGHIWLNRQNEIGLSILQKARRKGYEAAAIMALLDKYHPLPAVPSKRSGSFVVNISPNNRALIRIIERMGGEKIQQTYRLG